MIWKLDNIEIVEEARFDNVIAVKIQSNKKVSRKNYTIKDNFIYNENDKKVLDLNGKVFGKITDFLS